MLDAHSTQVTRKAQRISIVGIHASMPAASRREASAVGAMRLGWLAELTLLSTYGLLMIAFANAGGMVAAPWAEALFWAGLMLVLVPNVARLAAQDASRAERIGLVVLLVMAMYLVKILHSPVAFTFADELVHAYNVETILDRGRLFAPNSILPVTPLYPGLEIAAAALASLSGLSPFLAGLVVVGVARLVLALGLFLLFEQLTGSPRVAGLGAAMFAGQPTFLFWSAQFSYESLSFPLAICVLYVAARRHGEQDRARRAGYMALLLALLAALVVTHHLTIYALTLLLAAWAVAEGFQLHLRALRLAGTLGRWVAPGWFDAHRRHEPGVAAGTAQWVPLAGLAFAAAVLALAWLFLVATPTISYLSPVLSRAVLSIVQMVAGEEGSSRQLFVSSGGYVAPLWERLVGIGSVLVSLVALPIGLYQIWRRYCRNSLTFLLGLVAVAYFGMLAFRFTGAGWETANRATSYLFLGLAMVLGLAVSSVPFWRRGQSVPVLAAALLGALIFAGGIIAGWAPTLRLAQPLVVQAGPHTIWPQGWAAAAWAQRVLGPQHATGSDPSNGRLLQLIGHQYALAGKHPNVDLILGTEQLEAWHVEDLARWEIRYLLVDRRRAAWNNMAGYFFGAADGGPLPADQHLPAWQVEKFDREDTDRIFDSGDIVIYDIEGLDHATGR